MREAVLIEHAIRTLRSLAPWPVMKAHLKSSGLPVTRGWDELSQRLNERLTPGDGGASGIADKLLSFLGDYHLHGEKWVTFFPVSAQTPTPSDALTSRVEEAFLAFEPLGGDAVTAYPFKLQDSELGDGDSAVTLVATHNSPDFIHLVFSTTLAGEVKETIYPGANDGLPPAWAAYEEIVLVRKKPAQIFPVVSFDRNRKMIQVKVPLVGSFAAEDVIRVNVINALNSMLRQRMGNDFPVHLTLNLYSAISAIYLAENEGKIIELGFNTDTGSAKLERMKTDDLRTEIWHDAGKAALRARSESPLPFVPFRLAVRLQIDGNDVDLTLPGTTRTVATPPFSLQHTRISGTVTLEQFQSSIDRLLHYVTA